MKSSFFRRNFMADQHPTLYYKNAAIEKQFQRDVLKYQSFSLRIFLALILVISVILILSGLYSVACLLPILSMSIPGHRLNMVSGQLLLVSFNYLFWSTDSFMETQGIRIIPCMIHFLLIKRWTILSVNIMIDELFNLLVHGLSLTSVMGGIVFVIYYAILEKDVRDIWLISTLTRKRTRCTTKCTMNLQKLSSSWRMTLKLSHSINKHPPCFR